MEFGRSSRQEERDRSRGDRQSHRSWPDFTLDEHIAKRSGLQESQKGKGKKEEKGKGKRGGLEHSQKGKGKGSGLQQSQKGKAKGKGSGLEESQKGKSKARGLLYSKGKEERKETMQWVKDQINQAEEDGFDGGLQESRGRVYRQLRKLQRKNDPAVQARRAEYESGKKRLEKRPLEMQQGSQRWRKAQALETELNKREKEMIAWQKQLEEEVETQKAYYQEKLEQLQELQKEQFIMQRGLKQSQSSGSKEPVKRNERLRLEKKPQEDKKALDEEEESFEEESYEEIPEEDPGASEVDYEA